MNRALESSTSVSVNMNVDVKSVWMNTHKVASEVEKLTKRKRHTNLSQGLTTSCNWFQTTQGSTHYLDLTHPKVEWRFGGKAKRLPNQPKQLVLVQIARSYLQTTSPLVSWTIPENSMTIWSSLGSAFFVYKNSHTNFNACGSFRACFLFPIAIASHGIHHGKVNKASADS